MISISGGYDNVRGEVIGDSISRNYLVVAQKQAANGVQGKEQQWPEQGLDAGK